MIYQSLVDLAEREGLLDDPSYEWAEVHYLVHLGPAGTFLGCTAPRNEPELDSKGRAKDRPRPPKRRIPKRSDRTSGDSAEFLVDKPEYVFGIDPQAARRSERAVRRHQLFLDRIDEAVHVTPESQGLRAVSQFLATPVPNEISRLLSAESTGERSALAGTLFAFVYEPDGGVSCVHDEAAVKASFARWLDERENADTGQCLVTGELNARLTRLHAKPKGIPPSTVTGGGVALTSTNQKAFESYGLGEMGGAPISRAASVAIEIALTRLLDPAYPKLDGSTYEKRYTKISTDTVVVYWSAGDSGLDFLGEFERADPERVAEMFRSPYKGHLAPIDDPSAFYALVLSGMKGRGIVRSFLQSTVAQVAANLDRYRAEARIVRPFEDLPGGYPLQRVMASLVPRGNLDALPPALGTEVYLAILRGRPFPHSLLEALVRRARIDPMPSGRDGRRDDITPAVRCSLLKAYLNRNEKKEVTVALDTARTDPPYRLGRLLAVLDRLQQDALGNVNATIIDRYYGSASSTPEAIFPTLIRRAQHHIGKLRREKPPFAINTDRLLQAVLGEVHTFPKTLNLEQQALFALGFYHQRQDFFTKKAEAGNV